MPKQLLPFVSNDALYSCVQDVLDAHKEAVERAETKLHANVIDPFSAVFDSLSQHIKLSDWRNQEKTRQINKTLSNAVGTFHQELLGSIEGWESILPGNVIDIRNTEKRIIAEVKNKHNTTKGNHKKSIYDDLHCELQKEEYKDYKGYYVEIVPKSVEPYDKPFTPSDNTTHMRRQTNEQIRVIDGYSFYALATGNDEALELLYGVLPDVISDILNISIKGYRHEELFLQFFERAYPYKP